MNGQNVFETISKNVSRTAEEMFDDGVGRAKKFIQTGKGRRRRRRRTKMNQIKSVGPHKRNSKKKVVALKKKSSKKKGIKKKKKSKSLKRVKKNQRRKKVRRARSKRGKNKFLQLLK